MNNAQRLLRRLPLLVGAVAFALGCWGFARLHGSGSPAYIAYRAIELFTITLDLPDGAEPNWQVSTAALLAPLATAGALLQLVGRGLGERLIRGHRHHTVICGAGVRGSAAAVALLDSGAVVMVDVDPGALEAAQEAAPGSWVVHGDATHPAVLRRAGVRRAARIVVVAGDDAMSGAVAAAAARVVEPGTDVTIHVHLDDPALLRGLPGQRPAVVGFSTRTLAAERCVDDPALPAGEALSGSSFVIVGTGPTAAELLTALHRRWVVAATGAQRQEPPRVTLIGDDPAQLVHALAVRHGACWTELQLQLVPTPAAPPGVLTPEVRRHLAAAQPIAATWITGDAPLAATQLAVAFAHELGPAAHVVLLGEQPIGELAERIARATDGDGQVASVRCASVVELAFTAANPAPQDGERSQLDRDRRAVRLAVASRGGPVAPTDIAVADTWLGALGDGAVRDDALPSPAPWHEPVLRALELPGGAPSLVRARLSIDLLSPQLTVRAVRALLAVADEGGADDAAHAFDYVARVCRSISDPASPSWTPLLDALAGAQRDASDAAQPLATAMRELVELRIDALRARGEAPAWTQPAPEACCLIAGGASSAAPAVIARAEEHLAATIAPGWAGALLVSGGTAVGVPGVVGALVPAAAGGPERHGFLPRSVQADTRYERLHPTEADDFTIAEALAAWRWILDARETDPRATRLLAYPGGPITAREIAVASALEAEVGVVDLDGTIDGRSPREVALAWPNVVLLPDDPWVVRAFLRRDRPPEGWSAVRDAVAEAIHASYVAAQEQDADARLVAGDPALAPWDALSPTLRDSNRAQADDLAAKLAFLGLRLAGPGELAVEPVPADLDPSVPFSDPRLEELAKLEHGRWVIERLRDGWQPGPRDPQLLLSPYLVGWDALPEAVRRYDRAAVAQIGSVLRTADLRVAPAVAAP